MEKNQPFFDPYNFNIPQQITLQQQQQMPPNPEMIQGVANPAMYYEQQYMYYKYLTQMLEYKIKLKEWEKMNKDTK